MIKLQALGNALESRGWDVEDGGPLGLNCLLPDESKAREYQTQLCVYPDGQVEICGLYGTVATAGGPGPVIMSAAVFDALRVVEAALKPRVDHAGMIENATAGERIRIAFGLRAFDEACAGLDRIRGDIAVRIESAERVRAAVDEASNGAGVDA